jgi:hypothetical protein
VVAAAPAVAAIPVYITRLGARAARQSRQQRHALRAAHAAASGQLGHALASPCQPPPVPAGMGRPRQRAHVLRYNSLDSAVSAKRWSVLI